MADVFGTQDVTIRKDDGTLPVDVITDMSAVNRLAVDVAGDITIVNNESPTKYQLRTDYDATGDSVGTGADVTLYSFTGSGVIDFIGVIDATSSNYEVAIVIDGTERLRISMSALGNDLGMAAAGIPLYTEVANKAFRYVPVEVGFTTGFSVKAKALVSGTRTLRHVVLFREKVA